MGTGLYQIKEWDSNFFKFKIGILNNNITNYEVFYKWVESNSIKLIYYFSKNKIEKIIHQKLDIQFICTKMRYAKKVTNAGLDAAIMSKPYEKSHAAKELYDLAVESGKYSRFKLDPNISKKAFQNLFKLWMDNSITKKIADEVFIYEMDNTILGMCTCQQKEDKCLIGLIAVSSKSQGRGIGSDLIARVEEWAYENNCKEIEVITQKENLMACSFYLKCNFHLKEELYVYHIWNKKIK